MTKSLPIGGAALLLAMCVAVAGDGGVAPNPPVSAAGAADEVARLAASSDDAGLARYAASLRLDPWLVADELCARSAFDSAEAYARSAPAARCGGLAAFISAQRTTPTSAGRRAAFSAAVAARVAGHPAEAVRIIDAAVESVSDVISMRLLGERALDMAEQGNHRGAVDAFLSLVEKARAMNWPVREALLTEYAALQAQACGDPDLAVRLWNRMAEIHHGVSAPADEGKALHCLARVQFEQGRYGEALLTMRRALPLVSQGDAALLGPAMSALALYEDAVGDLAAAIGHHDEALRLLESSPQVDARVRATINASRTLFRLNEVGRAIDLAERAARDPGLAIAPQASERGRQLASLRGQALLNLAGLRTSAADADGAAAALETAATEFAEAGDSRFAARVAAQRGDLLAQRGDLEAANRLYDEALAIVEPMGDRSLLGLIRLSLGDLALRRGATDEALRAWESAILDARESASTRVEAHCLRRIAEAMLEKGRDRDALVRARAAVAVEGRWALGLGADEAAMLSHGGLGTSSRVGSEIGITAARRLGDVGAWFEMAEFGRANALAESVGGRPAIQAAAISESLTAEADAAAAALARATEQLPKARATGDLVASRAAAEEESAASERVRVVQDRIERAKKNAARLDAPTPPGLEQVRTQLGKGRALVVFHVGESTAEALVATSDAARLVDLGEAKAFVDRCVAVAASEASAESVAAAKAALVDALSLPKDVRTLLVVPDGPVASVPFALLDADRDVAIVPSALVWTLLDRDRDQRGAGVLAVGDPDYAGTRLVPLPSTRAEAEAVGTRTLLGKDATEDAVRRALVASPRWRAVHFACHGVVDTRHASLSGLALTRAGQDDGMFTARDVLGLPVPADVVVLSACEAGRAGAQSAATGVPPAFLAAGAPRVVANLWTVDDEAGRVFSVAFHKAWAKEGATAAGALRAARDAVRADPRFAAPRHWAGWVLWGLPD